MVPFWLHALSIASLVAGAVCAAWIAFDETRRPQPMWIMYAVWPVVALFAGALAIWLYNAKMREHVRGQKPGPSGLRTTLAASFHCGAGCTLGDIAAEGLASLAPSVALFFGWQTLFAEKIFAVWILDYVFAFVLGIAFQYFTIAPMRKLGVAEGLKQALKADTLSLTSWQIGMYGFMAIANFLLFRAWLGTPLSAGMPEFWFMMQIAMLFGLATSYPVNAWLLKSGIKEPM